jgi:hypothetical protein
MQNQSSHTTEADMSQDENKKAEEKKSLLFGVIQYTDDTSYEKFIHEMNLNQALFILIASANFAQAKGAFNILESETLATAIRTIKKNSTQDQNKTS